MSNIFTISGQVTTTSLGNAFIDLGDAFPFITSAANVFITSLVSKTLIPNFEPTYFQIPYIYSSKDNLSNGNYTSSVSTEPDLIITTYKIPYKGEFKEEIATIITYFNTVTKILFYEIPREFTYNSKDQASVSIIQLEDLSFSGKILIPVSFIEIEVDDFLDEEFPFTITVDGQITATAAYGPEPNCLLTPTQGGTFSSVRGNNPTTCREKSGCTIPCISCGEAKGGSYRSYYFCYNPDNLSS
jgi:hypothetical protein